MKLEQMIGLAEDQARRVLIGTKEELAPSWLVVEWNGDVKIIATPWQNTREKQVTVEAMRAMMRAMHAQAYSLLVEAWYATASPEEVANKEYIGPRPSERADRKEAVVAMAADRSGAHLYRHWEIVRDKQGACLELRRLDSPEDKINSALFDNLLDDRRRAS